MKFYYIFLFLFLSVGWCACDRTAPVKVCHTPPQLVDWDSCNQVTFNTEQFDIYDLPDSVLFYKKYKLVAQDVLERERSFDKDSIPVKTVHGKVVSIPTAILQYLYALLDERVYGAQDTNALHYIEYVADRLLVSATSVDSSLLIPYTHDFPMHGNRKEVMKAPWYSAMAQGQMLSLMVRLYEYTGKEKYLEYSKKLFNAFKRIKGHGAQPWISCIDKNNNIWYEEYPSDLPAFTLNGKIFAILGLYDYYRVTKDAEVKHWLNAGLTTIKKNMHRFRVEGERSLYCLKHYRCQIKAYHPLHAEQLDVLYEITGESSFAKMARAFKRDTPSDDEG